jgi:hypothetical protein
MSLPLPLLSAWLLCIPLCAGPINSSSFSSDATLINFDNLAGGNCNLCGQSVTDQFVALGVTFNDPSFPGSGTADSNLAPLIPGASPANALFVFQGGLVGELPADPFQILFSVPVTMVGFDFGSSADSFLRLDVYDSSNVLLDTVDFVGNAAPIGLAGFAGIEESTPIARVDVSYRPDGDPSRTYNFSIDNLQFEGDPAPEPSTFVMMAAGFLGIALGRRRKLGSGAGHALDRPRA